MAGVEPTFTVFEGDEDAVRAFIADVNLERRDLKKGQKAMALAMLFPRAKHGGARTKGSSPDSGLAEEMERAGITKQRLSEARAVLDAMFELAKDVMADRTPLDKALADVKEQQAKASSTEAKTARLREAAPDLADLVVDERMKLDEALAALEMRERKAKAEAAQLKKECEQRTTLLQRALAVFNPRGCDPRAYAERLFSEIDLTLWPALANDESSIECWADAAKTLAELVQTRKDKLS
jgi:hypothetical protein